MLWTRRRGEDGEKWSDFACFLKVVTKGLREPLDEQYESKKGTKNDTKIFSLKNWKDEFAFFVCIGKSFRRKRIWGKDKVFIWGTLSLRCLFDIQVVMAIN